VLGLRESAPQHCTVIGRLTRRRALRLAPGHGRRQSYRLPPRRCTRQGVWAICPV